MTLSAEQYQLILALAGDELSGDDLIQARSLLSMNSDAQNLFHFAESIRELLATDDSVVPSKRSLANAKLLFARHPSKISNQSRWKRWFENVEKMIAQLVFDSRSPDAMVGFRASAASSTTRLTFEIDAIEIDLELATVDSNSDDSDIRVMGQVSAESITHPTQIAFARHGTLNIVGEATTDSVGVFELIIPNATHDMMIRTPHGIVVAEQIKHQ